MCSSSSETVAAITLDPEIRAEMGRTSVLLEAGKYELELIDEPPYSSGSADNIRCYSCVYDFTDGLYRPSSRHGLVLREDGLVRQSCILLAGGGTSGLHENSAVTEGDVCFIAVGDTLCSLALPSLDLLWHRQVDTATCFGVYYSAKHHSLISHGELEIVRISLSGEITWKAGGGDIFSEGFKLHPDSIEVIDFNRKVYCMDFATGALMKTP